MLLMLDCTTRSWVTPVLPTQRCGRRKALWVRRANDFAHLPSHILIGGSFQSLVVKDAFEAAAVVPSVPGLHVVQNHARGRQEAWIFLRSSNPEAEPQLAEPSSLLVDDVEAILHRYQDRLRVE